MPTAGIKDPRLRPHHDMPTKNFFAPLRATDMECEGNKSKDTDTQDEVQQPARKTGRPPPIVLTSQENLIAMQKKLKGLCKGTFELRSTRNGARIITKEMADFSAIRTYLENQNLPYFTFFPKSQKPIKAVIRHLPINTPAEDISDGLVEVGFDVITVRQMTTTRGLTTGQSTVNLPLFLITLPRTPKSQEIFKLTSLCYIAVKVEAYKAQTGLTQCYNCQQFGHVWANCKQPPRCLWCGGGHLHKECPEKENATSKPACCNCKLGEGEEPHPSNYRGCSHAREELRKKKLQRAPKPPTGRVFSSRTTSPGVSFAAALRANTQQQQAPHLVPQASKSKVAEMGTPAPVMVNQQQKESGQSAQASNVSSASLNNMFRVATAVQQIMTELNGAVSEEDKIVAITKIVLNLMKQDGC
jgi:hypothetical protein